MQIQATDRTIAVILNPNDARDLAYIIRKSGVDHAPMPQNVTPMLKLLRALEEFA